MYKESKVEKGNLDYLKSKGSAKVRKIDHTKHQNPELAIKQILEKQELFLELSSYIYQKLLDLDKKYEAIKNPGKHSSLQSLTTAKVSVNQIIFDAINITKNPSKISIRLGLDVDIEINVDGLQLLQVLSGILQNSILFTREGQIKIESFVVKDHNLVIIRICDTGEKFKENDLTDFTEFSENKVDNYSRLQTMDITNFKKIISSHGGSIEIKNNNLIGVTFTISLPIE